jgi:signal transduction histidine kinase
MFRTIFAKQFTLYLSVLLLSFSILGAVLSQVLRLYLVEQRVEALQGAARNIADELRLFVEFGESQTQAIINSYERLQYFESKAIVLRPNMTIFVSSESLELDLDMEFNHSELQTLRAGQPDVIMDGLPDVFPYRHLMVGYPIRDRDNDELMAFALLISPVAHLENTIWGMYINIVISLFIAAIIGFILNYLISRSMSKPLRSMSQVAKEISSGDFEKRVVARGRDEVGQLARSLNNMAESLNKQERDRREFIGNISHDLRTPLTSIRGFIKAIKDGAAPANKISRYLGIVLDETERLTKLADDIVDISQIQAKESTLRKTNFDLSQLIREIARLFETRIMKKQLQIRLSFADDQNMVNADSEKIQRVIYNLLDNAIKFTDEDGAIVIETIVKKDRVFVTVRDNGIGISPENQKQIFDRFYKADPSRGLDKTGNGLGLSIVKEFVRMHGSTIELVSTLGKGSAFTFDLEIVKHSPPPKKTK